MSVNVSNVYKNELCTGCGMCASVCPAGCISVRKDEDKGIMHAFVDESNCNHCGICVKVCPGEKVDFNRDMPDKRLGLLSHPYVGKYYNIYFGCTNDNEIRFNGASGGMVTAFLLHILEKKLVDGVVVSRMSKNEPLVAETFIARSKEEIISAQKSIYCPVPLGLIMKTLQNSPGRYAVVGLPCHIHAIRKMQKLKKELVGKIVFTIGLFCSRTPSYNATRFLLENKGINSDAVSSISYRGNGHPGLMTINLKDGKSINVPHLDYDYWGYMFFNFFIPTRCFLCADKVAALADISVGDNWSALMKYRGGTSTIIVRDSDCLDILRNMERDKLVVLQETGIDVLIHSQDLTNKCNIASRAKLWKLLGGALPDYGTLEYACNCRINKLIVIIPKFIKYFLSRRKYNFKLLKRRARIFWMVEQLGYKISGIMKKILKTPLYVYKYLISPLLFISKKKLEKNSKYKIVMIGGYGCRDIGDEAMPHADIINLRSMFGDRLDVVMLSPDPEYTREFHKERSIKDINELTPFPLNGVISIVKIIMSLYFLWGAFLYKHGISIRLWPNARNVLDEMASCDLLFNVGGGNLNSVIPQELYKKGLTYIAADILNKPIILSGQTAGPYTKLVDRLFSRYCLNKVHMITFRDKKTSHERLLKIGVSGPVMVDAADDAMTIPLIDVYETKQILIRELGANWVKNDKRLKVAMNLKGSLKIFKQAGEKTEVKNEIELMAIIADSIIDKYDAQIVFIPTDYCDGVDDRELHTDVVQKMHNKHAVKTIEGEYNDTTLKSLIGMFDAAIGARYHFCVFAASMLVPYCGIASGVYQRTKLQGLSDLCGLPQCYINEDMETASFDDVWGKIQEFIKDRQIIKQKLKNIVPVLKEKSLIGVKEVEKILKNNKGVIVHHKGNNSYKARSKNVFVSNYTDEK